MITEEDLKQAQARAHKAAEREARKLREDQLSNHDGRPRDGGDFLEALKREHPEIWKQLEAKKSCLAGEAESSPAERRKAE